MSDTVHDPAGEDPSVRTPDPRLRSIIDSALDAIVATNAQSIIIEWNRRAEEIFGWTAAEAVGQNLSETIIPAVHRDAHRRGVERYLTTGEGPILNSRIEIEAHHRDGRIFPVELTVAAAGSGDQLVFNAFIRDLTEQKLADRRRRAEHAVTRVLAQSHSLQEAALPLLEQMGSELGWEVGGLWSLEEGGQAMVCAGVWVREDVTAGEFAAASLSSRFARGTGLPGRVWASGEPTWIADIATDAHFARAKYAGIHGLRSAFGFPIIADGEVLGIVEFFSRTNAPPDDLLLATMRTIGTSIGHAIRRVRAEQQRDALLADLERMNEHLQLTNTTLATRTREAEEARALADAASRAKSEFLAVMSHELRTPINGIIGYAQLLELGISGSLSDQQRAQVARIRSNSSHLLTLVNDILDLAKVESGKLTVRQRGAAAGAALEAALSIVGPQAAEQGIELESHCEGGTYLGDEARVRQILVNLLSNAIKFTERGGRVSIRCGPADRVDPGADLPEGGRWTRFDIEDTGIGMSVAELEGIFEAFVQAETGRTRTRGGTGLGLTISRQLARLMGGDITVRSTPGVGSCFTLWLRAQAS